MSTDNGNTLNQMLQGFGIIALALCSFLGMLYMRRGDMVLTGIIIILGVLALFGMVYLLWQSKAATRNSGFGAKEGLLLAGVALIGFAAYIPIFHFSNLEFNSKTQIKNLGVQIVNEIRNLPTEFDKQAELAMTRMETELSVENISDENIESRKKTASKTLDIIKQELEKDDTELSKNASIISNWNRLKLNQAFYDLDEIYSRHVEELKEGFEKPTVKGWSGEFEYERQYEAGEIISDPKVIMNNPNIQS